MQYVEEPPVHTRTQYTTGTMGQSFAHDAANLLDVRDLDKSVSLSEIQARGLQGLHDSRRPRAAMRHYIMMQLKSKPD